MITFTVARQGKLTAIVELSYWDMIKLYWGRELVIQGNQIVGNVILRQPLAYAALNLDAKIR